MYRAVFASQSKGHHHISTMAALVLSFFVQQRMADRHIGPATDSASNFIKWIDQAIAFDGEGEMLCRLAVDHFRLKDFQYGGSSRDEAPADTIN